MPADTTAVRKDGPPPAPVSETWRQRTLRTTQDIAACVGPILDALDRLGYSEKETFAVRLALEEALVNAIKHGHGGDPTKQVRLRYHINPERFLAEVEDEGPGFDPFAVPDPLDPANLERESGRGVFLMRHHMTAVCYNAAGNCVTLCKRRGQHP
jgi:serine/threonine-protein kinase RsbW